MKRHYQDILDRIPAPPIWWDEHGVPRYCVFAPTESADIYADEVALVLIECQDCRRQFAVAICPDRPTELLADSIRANRIEYGDPPNVHCCPSGPTMSSIPRRVIEYWRTKETPSFGEWERDASLEIAIDPDWMKEGA